MWLQPNMIVRSFKKCGISNCMDGSEDDILFDDVCGGNSGGVTDVISVNDEHEGTETDAMDYADAGVEMTDTDIQKLSERDDEEEDFLGF